MGDTIVALSSGGLPSGVAIIRVSGPRVSDIFFSVTGIEKPVPRQLSLCAIKIDEKPIDRGLSTFFRGPHSFTGEDCAEFQVHGSPAVVRSLLAGLTRFDGVRLADAGEFTRRAFENGKLDLVEIEGLGDLLAAETEGQRELALARMAGGLSTHLENWRQQLLSVRAEIEARLDFSDEGDVADQLPQNFIEQLEKLQNEFASALSDMVHGRIIREGFRVGLAGPPNAGKSSLLNALAKSDLAIVSDEPGTTRDVREVPLDIDGQLVILVDMAGIRETESPAEAEGIKRARAEIDGADLLLWLQSPDGDVLEIPSSPAPILRVATKADLGRTSGETDLSISIISGEGLDELMAHIREAIAHHQVQGHTILISRARDRQAIAQTLDHLRTGLSQLDQPEIAADALRQSSDALARLLGRMDPEQILGEIFSSFCIGK